MKIRDIPEKNRPRYRLEKSGPSALSDAELLAVILQKGSHGENVIDMCNRLLKHDLYSMSLTELQKIKGIGPAKAMQIIALFEFAKRQRLSDNGVEITDSKDVYETMKGLQDKKKEHFYCLCLDTKNRIIEKPDLVSVGILDASIIHPREIFSNAIRKSAKSVILVHNHPSGDVEPSKEDLEITQRLKESGELLDIIVLDHVIIGRGWYSFRDKGRL